jgi:hypothetical protein
MTLEIVIVGPRAVGLMLDCRPVPASQPVVARFASVSGSRRFE